MANSKEIKHMLARMLERDSQGSRGSNFFLYSATAYDPDSDDPDPTIVIAVNLSDFFYAACADEEAIGLDEIEDLYRFWFIDPSMGPQAWAVKKRQQKPLTSNIEKLKQAGLWSPEFDEFQ